jgi:hypothetical protein
MINEVTIELLCEDCGRELVVKHTDAPYPNGGIVLKVDPCSYCHDQAVKDMVTESERDSDVDDVRREISKDVTKDIDLVLSKLEYDMAHDHTSDTTITEVCKMLRQIQGGLR